MTSFDPWVYASCVPVSPQVINPVLGRTRPPSTLLSARYSPSWPLRVRLNIDTPPLVGFPPGNAPRSSSTSFISVVYGSRVPRRERVFPDGNTRLFNHLPLLHFSADLKEFYGRS